jgi:PBP1b-binding outer membrane lipoprotein LpoB
MPQKNMASVLSIVLLAVLIAGCIAPAPMLMQSTVAKTQSAAAGPATSSLSDRYRAVPRDIRIISATTPKKPATTCSGVRM